VTWTFVVVAAAVAPCCEPVLTEAVMVSAETVLPTDAAVLTAVCAIVFSVAVAVCVAAATAWATAASSPPVLRAAAAASVDFV
jgi:hypothetical protein